MRLASLWYESHPISLLLLPISGLFRAVVALRRIAYKIGVLRRQKLPIPVIVVGNITVGGTGKTPLVIWLAEMLRDMGHQPGIVSRGYRGDTTSWPQLVEAESEPAKVGDEPVLIALRTGRPVAVAPQRVMAARLLISNKGCDVIVSDDGLQHYALERDLEIVVLDGERRLGNGHCLPAGPLRETAARLNGVDLVVVNGEESSNECRMHLVGTKARSLSDLHVFHELSKWQGTTVHGVAGIGNPGRFFTHLRAHGLNVLEHPFPDHYRFKEKDLRFSDTLPVLMTEKDAVKCRGFANSRLWYVPVSAEIDGDCKIRLQKLIMNLFPRDNAN